MPDEANALRFALGMEAEPELLDIKPVALLTALERDRLEARLAAVEAEREPPTPATWWQWWKRL